MSIKRRLACVVIMFSFVLISQGSAMSDQGRNRGGHAHAKRAAHEPAITGSAITGAAISPSFETDIASQLAGLPFSAPVGHRQPRAADIHLDAELSLDEARLQRENDAVDRKLTICRGC